MVRSSLPTCEVIFLTENRNRRLKEWILTTMTQKRLKLSCATSTCDGVATGLHIFWMPTSYRLLSSTSMSPSLQINSESLIWPNMLPQVYNAPSPRKSGSTAGMRTWWQRLWYPQYLINTSVQLWRSSNRKSLHQLLMFSLDLKNALIRSTSSCVRTQNWTSFCCWSMFTGSYGEVSSLEKRKQGDLSRCILYQMPTCGGKSECEVV